MVNESGVVESLLSWADFKEQKDMKKTDGSKTKRLHDVPKLEDANEAGGSRSHECTLILTEGDSAKALAVSQLTRFKFSDVHFYLCLASKCCVNDTISFRWPVFLW